MKRTFLSGILLLSVMLVCFSCKKDESTILEPQITISSNTLEMNVGNTATLTAKITQWLGEERVKSNEDMSAKWESSNNEVVTVSGGKVTAVGGGVATIRAYSSSLEGVEAKCEVTVHDIYVCGEIGKESSSKNYKNIVIWKNGELCDSVFTSRRDVMANGMAIVGNDTYIAGIEKSGTKYVAKVWKNNVEFYSQPASGDATIATTIAVNGNDVYYAGYDSISATNIVAKIWKNGDEYLSVNDGEITGLTVDNGNIYAVGYVEESGVKKGKVWKNGTVMSTISGGDGVALNAIFVDGSGVYVAGYEIVSGVKVAKAWRNGSALYSLTNSSTPGYATTICLGNGFVYVGGVVTQSASYAIAWKNGAVFTLDTKWGQKSIQYARCSSIVASAGELIAVGSTYNNSNNQRCAILWRGGVIKSLEGALETEKDLDDTTSQNRATCVIVK